MASSSMKAEYVKSNRSSCKGCSFIKIQNILAPSVADPSGSWQSCDADINSCSPDQLSVVQEFRTEFLKALSSVGRSSSNGMFIDSCYIHCQTETQETWFHTEAPLMANSTIAKAVGDWFYERSDSNQKIDCSYPCNLTCRGRVFYAGKYPRIFM